MKKISSMFLIIVTISSTILILSPFLVSASSVTTTLNPSKDCYILYDYGEYGYTDNNYGGSSLTIGYSGAGYLYNSLLAFDCSSVTTVFTATLRLYIHSFAMGSHSTTFGLHCLTQIWGETTATWNSESAYNATAETQFAYSTSGTPGWYEIDISDTVKRWVAGTVTNNGIRIRGGMAGGRHCDIYSREGTYPPELVITEETASESSLIFILPVFTAAIVVNGYFRKRSK